MFRKIFLCTSFTLLLFSQIQSQTYQNAESIEYDEARNRFLISNGNNILARAADGTLSFFGTGSAGYGMEVMGDYLYALDPSVLKVFDLESGIQISATSISGSQFLNGLTNDGNGLLYATDFSAKKIYKIDVSDIQIPTYEVIVENTGTTPNGIVFDGDNNRLIFASWGSNAKIRVVDLLDYTVSDLIQTNLGNIDGIDEDSQQNYYISSWSPARITKYDFNFENPVVVTTPSLSNPADIGYAKAIDTLAVPQGNKADYIGFEVISNTKELMNEDNDFALLVYPNPVTAQSWIQFELSHPMELDVQIVDMAGNILYQTNRQEPAGVHKLPLQYLPLTSGLYQVILAGEGNKATIGVFKQ